MSIQRDRFAVEINYNGREYTIQEVLKYIKDTSGEGFADPQKLAALREESSGKVRELVEKHRIDPQQPLRKTGSPAGKDVAELVLQHCDSTIHLIVEGGHEKGCYI